MEINKLCKAAYENADKHGFYEDIDNIQALDTEHIPYQQLMNNAISTRLLLIIGEVSEAMEALRKNDIPNFDEELADVAIRLLDLCGYMAVDLEVEIEKKMKINADRPYKHGKEF